MRRQYTDAERIKTRALAAVVGAKKAAAQSGIPRRTVSYWLRQPAATPIIAAAELDVANMLRDLYGESMAKARAKILDPKTTAGELAQLIRVTGEQLALATGRATANIETHSYTTETPFLGLTDEEARDLVALLDSELMQASDTEEGDTNVG